MLAGLALFVPLLHGVQPAKAATSFTVNSTAIATDARPGDGVCATSFQACTLRAALHEANAFPGFNGILLPAGIYPIALPGGSANGIAAGDLDIESNVTITGAGAAATSIDAGGLDRVIEVHAGAARVHISGVTVRGGYHPDSGGGILNAGTGTVTLARTQIRDNSAVKFGGGVANEAGGTVRLVRGTRLSGNSAGKGGSAASNAAHGRIVLTDSTVHFNGSPESGAAIVNLGVDSSSGTIALTRADVSNNVSGASGGGIANSGDGLVKVDASRINGNRAEFSGGAIDNSGRGGVEVVDSNISGNRVGSVDGANDDIGDGGGIDNWGEGRVTVARSTISANAAQEEGGGLRSGGKGDLTVTSSVISGNSAASGGGIHAGGDGDVAVSDSTLSFNEAVDGAGMLSEGSSNGSLTLTRLQVIANEASGNGGGLLLNGGPTTIIASTFEGNSAAAPDGGGGGLANHASGEVRVEDSIFALNTTSGQGGGIHSKGDGPFKVTGTTLTGNRAATGGGLSSNADAAFTIENSTVSGNAATVAGGGAVVLDPVTLSSTTVAGNSAPSGGGLEKVGDSLLVLQNTIVAGNEGENCGLLDQAGPITSLGGNLDSGSSCNLAGTGDMSSIDPKLGPLAYNGGPTPTHALEPGSPAIDGGLASSCPESDQRGVERPQGGGCDVGAYEREVSSHDPPDSCTARGTRILAADADSSIVQSDQDKNVGSDSTLKVRSKSGDDARALVRFPLPAIPSGCTVISATLRLHAGEGTEGATLEVVRLASTWTEGGATWRNQPETAGAVATASSGTGARAWTVTSQVESMYSGANHGFLVRDSAEGGSGIEQGFHSREKGTDNPPELVITFG